MYENLLKITQLIALDNGGINRGRSAETQRDEANEFLMQRNDRDLHAYDAWLAAQDEDRLDLIASGGEDEEDTKAAREGMPEGLDDLLNEYFDEVC